MQTEWSFPAMFCQWVDPDTVVIRSLTRENPTIDAESIRGLISLFPELFSRTRYLYLLLDMGDTKIPPPSAESRETMREFNSERPFGLVVFGGSFAARTAILLVSRAMRLLGRSHADATTVKNEAEAFAWVAKDRLRHQKPAASVG